MIVLRNDSEIAAIRRAGDITARALESVREAVKPGVTTRELETIATKLIVSSGGTAAFKGYRGFPASICVSINDVVVHGIPSDRRLQNGDIVSVDIGVKYDGFYADAAISAGCGTLTEQAARLISVTEESLHRGIRQARPGVRLSEVSCAIQDHVQSHGFSVVRSFVGHGIGTRLHEEPEIPNFGKRGTGVRLEKGMVLAVEPMVNAGDHHVEVLEDGWTAVTVDRSLSAHFEHTIAITDSGMEILTKVQGR